MNGLITSIEPMGFNSGPGIRVIITMDELCNLTLTPKDTVNHIRKFRPYFGPDGGGVTFTGTNLFKQIDYIIETCTICHKAGITTCLLTDAKDYEKSLQLKHIDLVILEITSLPFYNYNNLTTDELMNINKFMNYLNESKIDVWIKQTIKKDCNDDEKYIYELKKFLNMFDNIKDVELISDGIDDKKLNYLGSLLN